MSVVVDLDSIGWEESVASCAFHLHFRANLHFTAIVAACKSCLLDSSFQGFFGRALKCSISLHNKIMS